jgi:hypothetical protein
LIAVVGEADARWLFVDDGFGPVVRVRSVAVGRSATVSAHGPGNIRDRHMWSTIMLKLLVTHGSLLDADPTG